MKKQFLVAILFLFPFLAVAQPEQRAKVNMQYGFRVSSNIMVTSREITPTDDLKKFFDTEFGVFYRVGKKIYGELGLSFNYQRNTFSSALPSTAPNRKTEFFETQYLPISARLVFYQPIGKMCSFMAYAGGAFHPLLKVTDNYLYYTKKDLNHQFSVSAGVAFKVKFLVLEVGYRQMLNDYFKEKESIKPGYVNVSLGVQLPY